MTTGESGLVMHSASSRLINVREMHCILFGKGESLVYIKLSRIKNMRKMYTIENQISTNFAVFVNQFQMKFNSTQ
jgi:hypothetical protein